MSNAEKTKIYFKILRRVEAGEAQGVVANELGVPPSHFAAWKSVRIKNGTLTAAHERRAYEDAEPKGQTPIEAVQAATAPADDGIQARPRRRYTRNGIEPALADVGSAKRNRVMAIFGSVEDIAAVLRGIQ